jgi:hypothetical protein
VQNQRGFNHVVPNRGKIIVAFASRRDNNGWGPVAAAAAVCVSVARLCSEECGRVEMDIHHPHCVGGIYTHSSIHPKREHPVAPGRAHKSV